MRQCEKHSGPHSDWFYDIHQSGGGAIMDMGCHGLAWFRWMLGGRPKVVSVYAHRQRNLIHKGRTLAEENSVITVEFEGGAIGVVENSWAKHGGMDDRGEVYGTGGVVYADLFIGNSALSPTLWLISPRQWPAEPVKRSLHRNLLFILRRGTYGLALLPREAWHPRSVWNEVA